ncbi:MAG: AI-2E family transporter [Bacteroidales bacterium]|nr:AI-2E family transporter [Bacteroidales bacterium]
MQNNEEYYNRSIYTALRIGFIALLLVWSFAIIKPFIMVALWGIIIAVAIFPLHLKFASLLGNRKKLSAVIITLLFLFLLITPSIIFIGSTVDGLQNISEQLEAGSLKIPAPPDEVADWKIIGKPVYDTWMLASESIEDVVRKFEPQIKEFAPRVLSMATGLGSTVLLFIISIIIGGALLTKDEASEKSAKSIFTTLIGKQGESFVALAVSTIRSVVQGVLGVAVIQAVLAGIGFWAIGMPAAGLWVLIVLMAAIMQIPALLILGPLAAYAFSFAGTTPAIIFAIWAVIVGLSDNILKPMLLGRGVDVPMLAILLGAIGGMMMSGIIGLFVGAVVLALSYKVFVAIFVDDVLDTAEPAKQNKN